MLDHTCDETCLPGAKIDPNGAGDYIACPLCERANPDCLACRGEGTFRIPCPHRFITQDVWDLIDAAELVKETHTWPGGVGWANEPAALVEGSQWVWAEFQRIKNELLKRK